MVGAETRTETVPVGVAVPSLARWGLTQDADLVYRTVATFGERSARALATELGLPARRVQRLRVRRMHTTGRAGQRPSHRFTPGVGQYLGEGVRHLTSREETRRRLVGLVAIERLEQLSINPEQSFDAASAQAAAPLDRDLISRGIKLRILGLPPADRDLHVDQTLLDSPRYGYREAAELPMKLIVVDRRVAFFPADPGDLEHGYLEVSHPAMVRSLVTLFERH